MLTILSDPTNALHIPWCLRSLSVEIRKTQLHLQRSKIELSTSTSTQWQRTQFSAKMVKCQPSTVWQRTQLSASMVQCQPSTAVIFKILKFSAYFFWTWHHPHSSLIYCLGFIMTTVIVLSFAPERKTVPNCYAHELLTWIVHSLTKLNDKI